MDAPGGKVRSHAKKMSSKCLRPAKSAGILRIRTRIVTTYQAFLAFLIEQVVWSKRRTEAGPGVMSESWGWVIYRLYSAHKLARLRTHRRRVAACMLCGGMETGELGRANN